jgi:hypothetical protein
MTQEKKLEKVFKSPSTGVMCDAAQYIAELMCLRKAEKDNKGNLSFKFWNKSQKKSYQAQIVAAHRLIDQFGEKLLLAFINSDKGKKIYSLGFYHPLDFVKKMINDFSLTYKEDVQKDIIVEHKEKADTNQQPRASFTGKKRSTFAKIKNLENKNGED